MIPEDKTGFEERVASPLPSSDSSDDEYSADEQDGTVFNLKPIYRWRALFCDEFLDPVTNSHEYFFTLEAVIRDVAQSDFSKRRSHISMTLTLV